MKLVKSEFKQFVIVGTQRTGSSALAERVGAHPGVSCGWEWTERVPWHLKVKAMKQALNGDFSSLPQDEQGHMRAIITPATCWIGFRRLFGASNKWLMHPRFSAKLCVDRMSDHLVWFAKHPAVHIVHIVREENLAWLKSKYVARSAGTFVGAQYPDDLKVHIPIREAIARLRSKIWIDEQLTTLKRSNPYMRVVYEDYVDDFDRAASTVLAFLGCATDSDPPVSTNIKRQSTRSDEEYIANYGELVRALAARGLA